MAVNKNALIRYKTLDRCFRNTGRRYDVRDLIEECSKVLLEISPDSGGVSRRTILQDIAFMESSEGWEIDLERTVDSKRVYFRYRDPSFSINNMPLNDVEISQLKSAIDTLSQFKGMPQFEWMDELIPKLHNGIVDNKKEKGIIQFDSNQYLKGIEHLGAIYNAIYNKRVLEVLYQPFGLEAFKVIFHAYCLKQYNGRWFAIGFSEEAGKADWKLALDRIISIHELTKKYRKNSEIDWTEYFEDIIGVTIPEDGDVEDVVLMFSPSSARYVESKPIHGSQKPTWKSDGSLEIKLNLKLNYELESVILSFGENVEVLKPAKLKKTIAERLSHARSKYK